jgi:5-methylcytosine-specific restriction enzyme subunit McrC
MPVLQVFEDQKIKIGLGEFALSQAEGERLTLIGEHHPGLCVRGQDWICVSGHSGIVSLGSRSLEILPKIGDSTDAARSRDSLLRMLLVTRHLPLRHHSVQQGLARQTLLDVFIAAFLESVAEVVRGGLMRRYSSYADDQVVVRGRIQLDRQLTINANRMDRVACAFDELEVDNPWNRLVKSALRAVRPWITSVATGRKWRELMIIFDEVSDIDATRQTWQLAVKDRHAVRYEDCLEWTRLILETLSPNVRSGNASAPGLLFDMSVLFQDTVVSVLQSHTATGGLTVAPQDTGRHLGRTEQGSFAFPLRPDVVLRDGARPLAIVDAKWKRVNAGVYGSLSPSPADVYQMHAYAAAYDCAELFLIYPRPEFAPREHARFVLNRSTIPHPRLHVGFVDLRADPFALMPGFDVLFPEMTTQ